MMSADMTARDLRWRSETKEEAAAGLAERLGTVRAYIRRYVVVSDDQATAITLWAAHTHAIDAADCTPYLHVTAATARAGKTRHL